MNDFYMFRIGSRLYDVPPDGRKQRFGQPDTLRSMHPADHASHTNAQWDELRVWDPGD